ncbi:hypothetical protein K7X08_021365 [Anisodus acutangulus]|uniref:Uncharacterized protein n=1 Tax=Anisodus acutangulus TaxID=402998 RepID=A0A9Q1M3A5_9SOLA|nr:hypothetical protein K7X08_021365 [Anisodus acutangulus]
MKNMNFHSYFGVHSLSGPTSNAPKSKKLSRSTFSKLCSALTFEMTTPTSHLVREMASGLVRIALESDKRTGKKAVKLLEEPIWRTYCNGRKCGYAMERECGPEEWKILNSIGPVSMGAGVLPSDGDGIGS